ncbi:unnamed protein product, partial [Closterium sp. NIES-54]
MASPCLTLRRAPLLPLLLMLTVLFARSGSRAMLLPALLTLYDAVVARYSSPATAALSHLMLPYLFPDLAAFATVTSLITHLRTSDTRYRAALPA